MTIYFLGYSQTNLNALRNEWERTKELISESSCDFVKHYSGEKDIYYHLLNGDCFLKGHNNYSLAHEEFIIAYNNSVKEKNNLMIIESIKKIIAVHLFNYKDTAIQRYYIDLHKQYSFSNAELLYNEYYSLKNILNRYYLDKNELNIPRRPWLDLIEKCEALQSNRLLVDVLISYGTLLSYDDNSLDESNDSFTKAQQTAKLFEFSYFNDISFISKSNISFNQMSIGNYAESLKTLNSCLKLNFENQKLENQAMVYKWISKCYFNLNKQDSAYQYLSMSIEKDDRAKNHVFTTQINEIESKYQNTVLQKDINLKNSEIRRKENIKNIFLVVSVLIGLLAYILHRNQRQKAIIYSKTLENNQKDAMLAQLEALQAERNRIASDMHDDIGAGLTRIKFLSDKAISHVKNEEEGKEIQKIASYSNELVRNMGEIIWAMNTRFDNSDNLIAYIRRYASEYLEEHNVELKFVDKSLVHDVVITGERRRNVFLVIKEVLHNIVKYSGAQKLNMEFCNDDEGLKIEIQEIGGKGFDLVGSKEKGNGLFNMEQRLNSINGSILIRRDDDGMVYNIALVN